MLTPPWSTEQALEEPKLHRPVLKIEKRKRERERKIITFDSFICVVCFEGLLGGLGNRMACPSLELQRVPSEGVSL